MVQDVRTVVEDVKVDVAVAVVVGGRAGHAVSVASADTRLLGHVGEGSVAIVAIQAVRELALEPAARVVVDVGAVSPGDEVDVEPAVTVVVEEHGTRARPLDDVAQLLVAEAVLEMDPGLLGHVGEDRHRRLVGSGPSSTGADHHRETFPESRTIRQSSSHRLGPDSWFLLLRDPIVHPGRSIGRWPARPPR